MVAKPPTMAEDGHNDLVAQPHTEDEVYYIASGRGAIYVAGENRDLAAGSVVFVKAGDEHRFHSIAEELVILVFFAPAEYANAPSTQ